MLWIYTSMYNHVVQDIDAKMRRKFPGVTVKWYQSGSENVAARLNMELLAGRPHADLVLTSDPFWYEDLKDKKALLPYDSPAAAELAPELKDPDHAWDTVRVSTMVIAYNSALVAEAQAPKSFRELADPRFKDKVAMPNPLESGTAFTSVAMLSRKLGWEYFAGLRANGALCAGGSSAVISRIETGERPVGIVLMENALAARRKGLNVRIVLPTEGPVLIPGPVAILRNTSFPETARQIHDFLLSDEAQASIALGDHHGARPSAKPPEGALPLNELRGQALPWDLVALRQIRTERDAIKRRFAAVMLD